MATPDYSGSTWYGAYSGNYTSASRPTSNPIDKIIIHVTQGSWSSAINWFKDSRAGVSAHYTVRSSDGFVGQSVQEKDIAYHAGNWPYNQTSIGIEHEGYVSDPKWFTEAMYRSSARLSAYLCKRYGIPADRAHLLGHNEVPNATHTDPGGNWDWARYISYVREAMGPAPQPQPEPEPAPAQAYSQVVDNSTAGRFSAGRAWKSGGSYRYTQPARVVGNAKFKVAVPAAGAYAVYGRWPANARFNNRTVFSIITANGRVNRTVNQRNNGGRWVSLGTHAMSAGDTYSIQVSNRSSGKGLIVADAVRIVRAG